METPTQHHYRYVELRILVQELKKKNLKNILNLSNLGRGVLNFKIFTLYQKCLKFQLHS